MPLMAALQALADRLGLDPPPHLRPDGRPRFVFLTIAGLISLGLWLVIGWGLALVIRWLAQAW